MTSLAAPTPEAFDGADPAGRAVDHFDLEMVEFVVRWAPYGGPPADECVPQFGMPLDQLVTRFYEIVRHGRRRHLDVESLALLDRASALLVVDGVGPHRRPVDPEVPSIAKPVLRRGVWRWS